MKIKKIKSIEFYHKMAELVAIANRGVQMALEENKRRKIPIVFSMMNKIYYRLPDGKIVTKSPFTKKK
jgi:hypothetical protein